MSLHIGEKEYDALEALAFALFAEAHPHEAYDAYPDQFYAYFHSLHPNIDRKEMERILRETDEGGAK